MNRTTRLLFAAVSLFGASLRLGAQPPTDPRVDALVKRIQELELSLSDVKSELSSLTAASPVASPAPAPPPASAPAPALAPDPSQLQAIDTEPGAHTLGPLQFRGYSDFGFGRALFEKQPDGGIAHTPQSFTLGDFDLFSSAQISPKLSMLGEVLVTSDFTNSFGAEIDRLLVTYTFNDYLKVTAGKYNTAIGYYTNAFHRARFFQTATGRPILFADEDNGGILPVHSIGMSMTGKIPSGPLGLHWVAEVANGRASQESAGVPVQNYVDENNGKAWNAALYARPSAIVGLQVGGSMYRDHLHPAGISSLTQSIYSGYVAYVTSHDEFLAEGVLLDHASPATRQSFRSAAGYLQISHQIDLVHPYFRYDYEHITSRDPVFGAIGRQNGPSFGIRFDITDYAAFKLQYGRLSVRQLPGANDFQAQLAFAF